jgi:DNA-binding NarL/FixJ family response regulator
MSDAVTKYRQWQVERAVKAAALALLSRDQTVAEVVAALAVVVDGELPADISPRERVAAVRQSRREQMLAELARHEGRGRKRDAVMKVARDFASDKLDGVEVASLVRKLHRWRRAEKKTVSIPPPESALEG